MSPANAAQDRRSGWSSAEGPGRKIWGGTGAPPPPPAVAVVQFYTLTEDLGCFASAWPLPPGAGNTLISSTMFRGGPALPDASSTPIGTPTPAGATCNPIVDIPGTEWTFSDAFNASHGDLYFGGYPIARAWRIGVPGEPQNTRWRTSGRRRDHYIEVSGLAGTGPSIERKSENVAGGAPLVSPALPVPGAGIWVCGVTWPSTGPDDGASPFVTLTARAPAQDTTQGYAPNYFGPLTWQGYYITTGAGPDIHVTLDADATPRDHGVYAWLCEFYPA